MRVDSKLPADPLKAQLEALPAHLKGQIIDGELIVQPRPRPRHARVITRLGRFLGPVDTDAGDDDHDHASAWWILIEPGIEELPGSPEIVPDVAGWRRSTLPELDLDARITVRPDWASEVLSPSNTRTVVVKKQAAYARAGVGWLWLLNPDPDVRTLQVFALGAERLWVLHSTFSDEPEIRAEPFPTVVLPLARLWT